MSRRWMTCVFLGVVACGRTPGFEEISTFEYERGIFAARDDSRVGAVILGDVDCTTKEWPSPIFIMFVAREPGLDPGQPSLFDCSLLPENAAPILPDLFDESGTVVLEPASESTTERRGYYRFELASGAGVMRGNFAVESCDGLPSQVVVHCGAHQLVLLGNF